MAEPSRPVAAILDGDDITVRRIAKNFQNLAGIHPIMPVENPGPRTNNKAGHRVI